MDIVSIGIHQSIEPKSERDRSREPQAGNAIGYAGRRLGRERPDLLERVKAGHLTTHRAMIEAGRIRPSAFGRGMMSPARPAKHAAPQSVESRDDYTRDYTGSMIEASRPHPATCHRPRHDVPGKHGLTDRFPRVPASIRAHP